MFQLETELTRLNFQKTERSICRIHALWFECPVNNTDTDTLLHLKIFPTLFFLL